MPAPTLSRRNCTIARALDAVGDEWTLLVIRDVAYGRHRFTDILDSLGIARNVLADRLRTLVDLEVLARSPDPADGRAHRYDLTERGRELVPVLLALGAWGDRWLAPDGPPIEFVDADGHTVRAAVVDNRTSEPLDLATLRPRRGPGWTD